LEGSRTVNRNRIEKSILRDIYGHK
jgi:hypothetical protein